jgi:hypothetical protein
VRSADADDGGAEILYPEMVTISADNSDENREDALTTFTLIRHGMDSRSESN